MKKQIRWGGCVLLLQNILLGAAFSIDDINVPLCFFVTSPVRTAMEIICLIQFRRSAASHCSLYQVLSLCSFPGVGGRGGGLCQRDWWRLADRRLGRSPSVPRCGRASHHPSPLYTSTCQWAGNNSSEWLRGRWHGCRGGGGTACQTPITVVPSSCSSST